MHDPMLNMTTVENIKPLGHASAAHWAGSLLRSRESHSLTRFGKTEDKAKLSRDQCGAV